VGKTTLARVLLEFRPARVPEPFWFSFQHNQDVNLETMLAELAGYLQAPVILSFKGIRKAGKIDINRLTDELMKRDSVRLVFDDLSYITDAQRKFKDPEMSLLFLALRDNTHRAKIILTSRVLPILDNGERLIDELEDENKKDLKGLETNFAADYLKANGLEKIEYDTLKSLSEGVCGHPFSLKLLVGLAKRHTLENVLKNPGIYKKSKEERIKNAKLLFDKLAGNEKELLERISVFRKPEPLEAINFMFADETPIDAVDNLLDKSLLETDNNNSYWLHPLVQEFSYEDLKNKKEAHMLAVRYYLSLQLPEKPSRKEDLQPALEAHYHACKAGEYDLAAAIIWRYNLHYLLDLWGNPRTLIDIYEKLLPNHFRCEPILKDKRVHGAVLGNLGNAYSDLGEPIKAIEYYEQALKISKEIGDRRGEGNHLGNLGNAYSDLGEPRKAIEYYEQALKISKEIGDRRGEGADLGNLGLAYSDLGEPRKAMNF
jgi:tetratricopeptide (TPR) repeat protein